MFVLWKRGAKNGVLISRHARKYAKAEACARKGEWRRSRQFRVAHASRVLVSASRRNELPAPVSDTGHARKRRRKFAEAGTTQPARGTRALCLAAFACRTDNRAMQTLVPGRLGQGLRASHPIRKRQGTARTPRRCRAAAGSIREAILRRQSWNEKDGEVFSPRHGDTEKFRLGSSPCAPCLRAGTATSAFGNINPFDGFPECR